MAKKTDRITQKQRNVSPKSIENLRPFRPGQSGNPGGNYRHSPKLSNVYARLLAMTPDEFKAFEPSNNAEAVAAAMIRIALTGKPAEALNATKEITDRTEGRARQDVKVDNTIDPERLVVRIQERLLAERGKDMSRKEVIKLIVAYRPELAEALGWQS